MPIGFFGDLEKFRALESLALKVKAQRVLIKDPAALGSGAEDADCEYASGNVTFSPGLSYGPENLYG